MKVAADNPLTSPNNDVPFVWKEMLKSIKEFNGLIEDITLWDDEQILEWSPEEVFEGFDRLGWGMGNTLEDLSNGEGGETGVSGNPAAGQHLGFWIQHNFGYAIYKKVQGIHHPISEIAASLLQEGRDTVEQLDSMSKEVQQRKGRSFLTKLLSLPPLMEEYAKEINNLLQQIYPERFKYEGFLVENPDHFAKPLVNKLLVGINFLKVWFKDTGLLKIFEKEIKQFVLKFQPYNKDFHATYTVQDQTITVYHVVATHLVSRLLKTWIKEVFIHEFAHHIHMKYIHGVAKEFWDSWWDLVNKASEVEKSLSPLSKRDRTEFWTDLIEHDYNPAKTIKALEIEGVDQIRFLLWLYNPSKGNKGKVTKYYNTGKPPKLTDYGKDMFSFYRDPWEFIEEHYVKAINDKSGKMRVIYTKKLQQEYDQVLGLDTSDLWPKIPHHIEKEIRGTLPTEVQAIDALGVPSDYARTNKFEDFAETFVSFVTNPRALSPLAQYRMKRTLSLSGLYGKPVMTFAKVVEALVENGFITEATSILASFLKEKTK